LGGELLNFPYDGGLVGTHLSDAMQNIVTGTGNSPIAFTNGDSGTVSNGPFTFLLSNDVKPTMNQPSNYPYGGGYWKMAFNLSNAARTSHETRSASIATLAFITY